MKKMLLLFCLLLIVNNLLSQFHLPKDSAEWKVWIVNNGVPYSSNLLIYQYSKDTSLNGYSQKVVTPGLFGLDSYIREVDSTQEVFFLMDYSDTVSNRALYNFSMSVGDTLKVVNSLGNPVSWLAVSDGFVQVGAFQRRYLDVKYVGFNYVDRWVEGIGSVRGLFAPILDPSGWFEQDFQLVCFTDKGQGLSYEPFPDSVYNCNTPAHVFHTYEVGLKTESINVYPNPFKERLIVENQDTELCDFVLMTSKGEKIMQGILQANENKVINSSILSSGLYILRCETKSKVWSTKLFCQ